MLRTYKHEIDQVFNAMIICAACRLVAQECCPELNRGAVNMAAFGLAKAVDVIPKIFGRQRREIGGYVPCLEMLGIFLCGLMGIVLKNGAEVCGSELDSKTAVVLTTAAVSFVGALGKAVAALLPEPEQEQTAPTTSSS